MLNPIKFPYFYFLMSAFIVKETFSLLEIERRLVKNSCDRQFCLTQDFFTNPTMKEIFCTTRNAKCIPSNGQCNQCECANHQHSFISYEYGCLTYDDSEKVHDITFFSPHTTLKDAIFHPLLSNRPLFEWYWPGYTCSVNNIRYLDPKTSTFEQFPNASSYYDSFNLTYQNLFRDKWNTNKGLYRLECSSWQNNCENLFEGAIFKFDILLGRFSRQFIMFKKAGKSYVNETTIIPKQSAPEKDGNLIVNRRHNAGNAFGKITNIFTNFERKNKQEFCLKNGANCDDESSDCSSCACATNDTFVSYKSGCQNTSAVMGTFSVGAMKEKVYSVDTGYLMYATCLLIPLEDIFHKSNFGNDMSGWSCKLTGFSTFHMFTGNETVETESPLIAKLSTLKKDHLCLQCKNFTCDLSRFSGMISKIGISCEETFYTIHGSMLLIFSGKEYVDASLYVPQINPGVTVKKSTHNEANTSLIGIICGVLFALVCIIVIVIFIFKRKRQKKRSKTRCAHYVAEEKEKQIELAKMKDENMVYAQVKIPGEETKATLKKSENLYYQHENGVQENSIYAEANLKQENTMYGLNDEPTQYISNNNGMYDAEYATAQTRSNRESASDNPIYNDDARSESDPTRFSNNLYEFAFHSTTHEETGDNPTYEYSEHTLENKNGKVDEPNSKDTEYAYVTNSKDTEYAYVTNNQVKQSQVAESHENRMNGYDQVGFTINPYE